MAVRLLYGTLYCTSERSTLITVRASTSAMAYKSMVFKVSVGNQSLTLYSY